MKVAVYYNNSDVRVEERERPEIGKKEILVKVFSSGICGSDVMEWYRIKKAPLIPGHEVSGIVEEAGSEVRRFSKGDRVAVIHKVPCNTCCHCLKGNHSSCDTSRSTNFDPGGFSEYVRVPVLNADRGTFLLPDTVGFDEATFIEPLSCAVRAQRIMALKPGSSVLVIGCGVAGLLHIKLAIASGAGKVYATDVSDYRLTIAKGLGAVPLKAGKEIEKELKTKNNGKADNVIVCTGAKQATLDSFDCIERGGTIMMFAVPRPGEDIVVPLNDFWTSEIKILSSYYTSPRDIETALSLLKSKRVTVSDLITHRLSLDEIQKGFKLVSSAGESVKVVINPHD